MFLPKQAECSPNSPQAWSYAEASWPNFWGHMINHKSGYGTQKEWGPVPECIICSFTEGRGVQWEFWEGKANNKARS